MDFADTAAKGRLHFAYEMSSGARKVSSPLVAFESPPRTDTFAFLDSFAQAVWECDEGDAVLRQDLALIEHHLAGKRVPIDTLLAYLAIKTYVEPRDDVKALLESYMSALASERKRGHALDWPLWQTKYAHLMHLYISCLFYAGQVEAAQSALEPHRVDAALLVEPARVKLEATLKHWIKLATPVAATAPAAATAAASATIATHTPTGAAANNRAPAHQAQWVARAMAELRQWSNNGGEHVYAVGGGALVLVCLLLVLTMQRRRLAGAVASMADALFGHES